MEDKNLGNKELEEINKLLILYDNALKTMETKIEILNENYMTMDTNPIEHVKTRLKKVNGIVKKLERKGKDISAKSIREVVDDVAGIRIICAFSKDIYEIADILKKQKDIRFIREKDYIKNPKPSGYRSYHMIVEVPVYTPNATEHIKVEIQIRTASMDFWACLEHKARYKYEGIIPEHLEKEFKLTSDKIEELDQRMFLIQDIISLINY